MLRGVCGVGAGPLHTVLQEVPQKAPRRPRDRWCWRLRFEQFENHTIALRQRINGAQSTWITKAKPFLPASATVRH